MRNRSLKRQSRIERVRAWCALRSQKRRRLGATPGLPVVTLFNSNWELDAEYVFTEFDFAVDLFGQPPGMVEVWFSTDLAGWAIAGTVATGALHFSRNQVSQGETLFIYKARYMNGAVVGPFSGELRILV